MALTMVCRRCDLPMRFEEENPRGYLLYICNNCANRTGLWLNPKDTGEVGRVRLKLHVLVRVWDLVIDGVAAYLSDDEARTAFAEYTEGLTPEEVEKREESNPEEHYSQTSIFEVEV